MDLELLYTVGNFTYLAFHKIKVQIIHFQFYSLFSYQTLVKSVTLFTPLVSPDSFHFVYSMCLYVKKQLSNYQSGTTKENLVPIPLLSP